MRQVLIHDGPGVEKVADRLGDSRIDSEQAKQADQRECHQKRGHSGRHKRRPCCCRGRGRPWIENGSEKCVVQQWKAQGDGEQIEESVVARKHDQQHERNDQDGCGVSERWRRKNEERRAQLDGEHHDRAEFVEGFG